MSTIQINETNRNQYGGDIEITSTVPAIHPKLGIPLSGLRADIKGASQYFHTLYKGDIIYSADPALEFNFAWWPNDGSPYSQKLWMLMTIEKGFAICDAKDWSIRPELRQVIETVDNQIVIRSGRNLAGKDEYHVLMYRTKARWQQEQKALQQVDPIAEGEKQIAASIGDPRVSALPTQISVTEHKYDVDDVAIKKRSR